ncbi:MAG: alpha/beta fold hydrolase, partial [Candidatus Competibacteraceae bacterium]
MSRIIKVAGWTGPPRANVIFVHGLGGHAYDTWRRKTDDDSFWPLWLAKEVEGLTVYTLGYEAPPSNWLGTAMPLQDRAVNALECLLGEPGLREGPITFICHSLGGLIVKQIMLDLHRQKGHRPEAAALWDRIAQVVFLATPHTGSRQGSWLDRLRFLAWPSSIARTLVANDPTLRAINVGYRGLADERRDRLHHRIFYETQGTPVGVIVDEASADPGLPGLPPIPIDADHVRIVKPADRSALQYART